MSIKENRKNYVSAVDRFIVMVGNLLLFIAVWFNWYGKFAFRTNRFWGGIATTFIYLIIYDSFARLYKAYKINTYSIGEILFSQILSFGLTDLIIYVECCLIARQYISILPGSLTAFIQIVFSAIWAFGFKQYYIRLVEPQKTLIICGMSDADEFKNKLQRKYGHLFEIKECVRSDLPIKKLVEKINVVETVILYEVAYGKRTDLMSYCLNEKKTFYITPRISDIIIEGFESRNLIDTPLLKYEYNSDNLARCISKRILDIIFSTLGLLITLPFTSLTMLAIKMEDGGDIFFKQKRYTKNWKVFEIIKFRSMVMDAEKDGKAHPCTAGDTRITKVGKIIRRFRIDEIPQLINVLKGDMSIVGPRPERVEHVHSYTEVLPEFSYRLRVKGGLTGYAQIYGKYNTSPYDKLKLDLMYIENQSFLMDLKLILLTVKTIFILESTEGFSEEKSKEVSNGSDKSIKLKC